MSQRAKGPRSKQFCYLAYNSPKGHVRTLLVSTEDTERLNLKAFIEHWKTTGDILCLIADIVVNCDRSLTTNSKPEILTRGKTRTHLMVDWLQQRCAGANRHDLAAGQKVSFRAACITRGAIGPIVVICPKFPLDGSLFGLAKSGRLKALNISQRNCNL